MLSALAQGMYALAAISLYTWHAIVQFLPDREGFEQMLMHHSTAVTLGASAMMLRGLACVFASLLKQPSALRMTAHVAN